MVLDVERARVVGEEGGVLEQPRRRLRHLNLLGQRALRGRLAARRLDVRRDPLDQSLPERRKARNCHVSGHMSEHCSSFRYLPLYVFMHPIPNSKAFS